MTGPHITWVTPGLTLRVAVGGDAPAALVGARSAGVDVTTDATQPLVEVMATGHGRARGSLNYTRTAVGARLRYAEHTITEYDGGSILAVRQVDPVTGIEVTMTFVSADQVSGFQVRSELRNAGKSPVRIEALSTFAVGSLVGDGLPLDAVTLVRGQSSWVAEGRWHALSLRSAGLIDIDPSAHGQVGRGRIAATCTTSWSTGESLPVGMLLAPDGGLGYQIEHNGPWHWEIAETPRGYAVLLFGPTSNEHQWDQELAPGERIESVSASVVLGEGTVGSVAAAFTDQRRAIRALRETDASLPVVFNDYMNALMGDPTTDALLPLIDAAASVGAEYFCIDCGWYDDGGDWWDSVGEWEASTTRFSGGLEKVCERIVERGMVPGLWLEPEVVGVRSPIAQELPDEAFMRRGGTRVVEHGRYQLDLSHPAAVAHLDATVDRLVDDYGIGLFKLDYNITPGIGTDGHGSPGAGLLAHNRGYLVWVDGVLARHPHLVIENCASGGMRADYATLSRLQLQSSSDQQNPVLYPPIAAGAPMSVLPEQVAHWAYPQPSMSLEDVAFTLTTSLAARLFLSGRLDRLDAQRLDLVREAVAFFRESRTTLAGRHPLWPTGAPGWSDDWVSLALTGTADTYLYLWRRPGAQSELELALPDLGPITDATIAFPTDLPGWSVGWDDKRSLLRVAAHHEAPTARVIRLVHRT